MTDFEGLLATLVRHEVAFIVVDGAAAIAHGSVRLTSDLDIVYQRSAANLDRLVAALAPSHPYLRGAPAGLPFRWDRGTLLQGLNFTLVSSLGDIDLLGEIPGGGRYEDLVPGAVTLSVFGMECGCLSLPQLIRAKRAAGRPRDLEVLAELEAIEEESGSEEAWGIVLKLAAAAELEHNWPISFLKNQQFAVIATPVYLRHVSLGSQSANRLYLHSDMRNSIMISTSPGRKRRRPSATATAMQQGKKVAVDFPAPLFQETERAAQELSTSRSSFIRSAVERYLAELRREKLEKELTAGYIANDLQAASVAEELAQLDAVLI